MVVHIVIIEKIIGLVNALPHVYWTPWSRVPNVILHRVLAAKADTQPFEPISEHKKHYMLV